MRLVAILYYYLCYAWAIFKSLPRLIRGVIWYSLPLSGLTILLGVFQGLVLGLWYHGTAVENGHFFLANIVDAKAFQWFEEAGGPRLLHAIRPPYNIPQLRNPLDWTKDLGLSRPEDWNTENVFKFASFNDLYRRRRRSSWKPDWHQWVYLSAQEQPLNETWNADPWDQAFLELLQYRDRHDPMMRSDFHYMTCHNSFLCGYWYVTAPALLHFTNEPLASNISDQWSRKPILDPVSVRVFELPLSKPIIPGVFPSYFEQMKALTASDSTFWASEETYSNFGQVRGQAKKVLKKIEDAHPWTYGALVKMETKWTELLAIEETALIQMASLIPFIAVAVPTYFAGQVWEILSMWYKEREKAKSPQPATNYSEEDPLAYYFRYFLDSLSEEDKEKFGKTEKGGRILRKMQSSLESKDWNTQDKIIDDIERASGKKNDGKPLN